MNEVCSLVFLIVQLRKTRPVEGAAPKLLLILSRTQIQMMVSMRTLREVMLPLIVGIVYITHE